MGLGGVLLLWEVERWEEVDPGVVEKRKGSILEGMGTGEAKGLGLGLVIILMSMVWRDSRVTSREGMRVPSKCITYDDLG